jgi:hypothetical protein
VLSGSKSSKNFFCRLARKPKGMRCPSAFSATTRKVRPPALAWLAGNDDGASVW